jgi:hypothetical protein
MKGRKGGKGREGREEKRREGGEGKAKWREMGFLIYCFYLFSSRTSE